MFKKKMKLKDKFPFLLNFLKSIQLFHKTHFTGIFEVFLYKLFCYFMNFMPLLKSSSNKENNLKPKTLLLCKNIWIKILHIVSKNKWQNYLINTTMHWYVFAVPFSWITVIPLFWNYFLFPLFPFLGPLCILFKNVLNSHLPTIPSLVSSYRFLAHVSIIILSIMY